MNLWKSWGFAVVSITLGMLLIEESIALQIFSQASVILLWGSILLCTLGSIVFTGALVGTWYRLANWILRTPWAMGLLALGIVLFVCYGAYHYPEAIALALKDFWLNVRLALYFAGGLIVLVVVSALGKILITACSRKQ
jgi:hypothetical protein